MSDRVALAVMRLQPLHKGHTWIINEMIQNFNTVIVALGSADRNRERQNPWTIEERQEMLRNVYGKRIKIVPLADLGTEQGSNDWCDYVLSKIWDIGGAEPTDYFTGSHADASWYKGRFYWHGDLPDVPMPSSGLVNYVNNSGQVRRLHILSRDANPVPPATDLRTFLATREDGWKQWVPAVNHQLVESTFPERFRVTLDR